MNNMPRNDTEENVSTIAVYPQRRRSGVLEIYDPVVLSDGDWKVGLDPDDELLLVWGSAKLMV